MSHRWTTPKSSIREKKLQWLNLIAHAHGIFCDCPDPMEHTAALIFEQEPDLKFKVPERDLIKKCLGGEPVVTAGETEDVDAFGPGDLDALFAEDGGQENDAR